MLVYRIADRKYINDLSGTGAAMYGGRWNSKNTYMLYTAESPALALLETVVHLGKIPVKGFCMATIDIPEDKIQTFKSHDLPSDWFKNPAPDYLKTIGDYFVRTNKYLALKIPSVIIPEEHNYLLNPDFPEFNKVKIINSREVRIDERLLFTKL